MDVYSPFEPVSFADVIPGEFVALEAEKKAVVALSVLVDGRDVGFLLLEGPNVGRVKYVFDGTVLRFKSPIHLALHYRSDAFGWVMPEVKIVAAVYGDDTYFIFIDHGVHMAANIKTGVLAKAPKNPCYVNDWAIRSDMQTEPVLQS